MPTTATPSIRNPARLDGSTLLRAGEPAGRILLAAQGAGPLSVDARRSD